jgi:hypothetical protein
MDTLKIIAVVFMPLGLSYFDTAYLSGSGGATLKLNILSAP